MITSTRRRFLQATGAVGALSSLPLLATTERADAATDTLTLANASEVSVWDPNSSTQALIPGNQSIYRVLYDPYVSQKPDLTLAPGACEKFGWNDDRSKISLVLRRGMKWHDGAPVTMDDLVWNLMRLADPKSGNPLQGVFASLKNFNVDGDTVTFDVAPWRANMLERLSFFTCYLMPKNYYEKVGADGFEKHPIGSGPYMFDAFERGSFVRLKAFPDYWGGPAGFSTVLYKFITDGSSRVAEIERGTVDVAIEVPYEDYDRLKSAPKLKGSAIAVADVAMIFFNNIGPFSDDNVRRAAVMAIDKKAICERIHHGYARPLDTLLTPEYKGFDPNIKTPYDPKQAAELMAKSGYSPQKPVELTFQTTRGYKPKDYETVEAIVQMWRRIGINANIEVYEIAKYFELRIQHKLAPAAFYDWNNATGDPESAIGTALQSQSPQSSWKGGQLDGLLSQAYTEKNEAKRMAVYREINTEVAKNAYICPLFQFYQPVLYSKDLDYTPHAAGFVLPTSFRRA